MGSIGPLQLVLVVIVALLVFGGRGRISNIMGDMAKGIRSFRQGLKDDEAGEDAKPEASKKAIESGDVVDVTPEKDASKTS